MNRFKRDKLKEDVISGEKEVAEEFVLDPELVAIRDIFSRVIKIESLGLL
jgi:hypothetical protein